jgi:hypothetical protein
MAGMLNVPTRTNAMAADAPRDEAAEPEAGAAEGPAGEATPQQKSQFNQFVDNAYKVIYNDEMLPKVQEGLKGNGDPASGLTQMAGLIILRVATSAFEGGIKDPGVLVAGGAAIIDDLAELSERLGIHKYEQDEIDAVAKQVVKNVIAARKNAGQAGQAAPDEMVGAEPAGAQPPRGMMPGMQA